MLNYFLVIVSILAFIAQVAFSIFYSVKIVDLSSKAFTTEKRLTLLQHQNQFQKIKYYQEHSLENINRYITPSTDQPIKQSLDLRP